jgi:hypothetical protein
MPLIAVPALYIWYQMKPGIEHIAWRTRKAFRSKRSVYREEVLRNLSQLACIDPRGRDYKIRDNARVLSLIDARYAENQSAGRAAIFIASGVQSHFVETLTPDQRLLVIRQLRETNAGQIASALQGAMEGKSIDLDSPSFETIVLGTSIFMAKALLDDGEIKQLDYEMFWSEIFDALAGKPSDQPPGQTSEA